ncbi:PREDICTED: uncharacterized protein LOC108556624 [Nicrophorus vespilloides]|uniref:Uncharacterized protein LOC108556624 n=1 Tax=Nicrophorus vespilloides TaxID=110193 RepID=A0ABM1M143_NICVS|nr:PREDICTED: uncharacterized protein LOC108556624 [Nicrophorus vespilloides]
MDMGRLCWAVAVCLGLLTTGIRAMDVLELIFGPRLTEPQEAGAAASRDGNGTRDIHSGDHDYINDAGYHIMRFGYPFEEHEVVTEDGYILKLHRIPYEKNFSTLGKVRKPVLLHHGIFGASENWLFRGPDKDLCYILSNAGYDVWLSNSRGNHYSRKHVTLDPNSDMNYWNFSYHEMGYYDLPASVDYILNMTNQTKIQYVGYSMGSTVGYIMLSTRPEYNKKISLMVNFAGTGIVAHRLAPHLKIVFNALPTMVESLRYHKIHELFPRRELISELLGTLCQDRSPLQMICLSIIYLTVGVDYEQFNTSYVPYIFKYYPSGTSIKTMLHYYQMFTRGYFAPLDVNVYTNNTEKANSREYDLSKITVPVSLHYGDGDVLVTKQDNLAMARKLRNVVGIFKVPYRHFNHLDFLWSSDSKRLLYDQVIVLMDKLNKMHLIIAATALLLVGAGANDLEKDVMALVRNNPEFLNYFKDLPLAVEEDAHLRVPELVRKYGYELEDYYLTNSDGYILNVHRIPYGSDGQGNEKRPVVFLQHGILSSSADWISPGPEKGLAYLLAENGYDVWMGNARGNRYSRNHTSLHPDEDPSKFWDFSWHEIGVVDLPEMIDFVLKETGEESLFYIGHSQGTTSYYVMCSERPEYNKKIRAHFSLAPIAYMNHMTSPLFKLIALAEGGLGFILKLIGMHEFLPTDGFLHNVTKAFCEPGITQVLCENSLFALCGFNKKQLNTTLLPIMMGHTPAGSSTKQFLHYAQEINSGKFRQYDYGLIGNMKRYNSIFPPNYKLKAITSPVYLFYSSNDWLSAVKDVNRLYEQLGNVHGKFLVLDSDWNHLDYMFGIDVVELVYNRILSLMAMY